MWSQVTLLTTHATRGVRVGPVEYVPVRPPERVAQLPDMGGGVECVPSGGGEVRVCTRERAMVDVLHTIVPRRSSSVRTETTTSALGYDPKPTDRARTRRVPLTQLAGKPVFNDRDQAEVIIRMYLEMGAEIDRSIAQTMLGASSAEFETYRRAAGRVMGEILLSVLNPIFKAHPDLIPPQMTSLRTGSSSNESSSE